LLSFCVDEAMEKFITGLFHNQNFAVITSKGSIDFRVEGVEILGTPTFTETMRYRTMMPICIAEQQEGRPQPKYLAPDEPNYAELIFSNLENKCNAAYGQLPTPSPSNRDASTVLNFKILSDVRKRGMETVKAELNRPIKLIGYNYAFELTAPIEWQRIGYEAGFGKSSSGGFGMCRVM
jgi:CRISPR-associated endoribonuclease Cas6